MSLQEDLITVRAEIHQGLIENGTNVELNEADPYGDGDQSMIPGQAPVLQQFYRDLYADGGDINVIMELIAASGRVPLSDFAKHCVLGNVPAMRALLKQADTDPIRPSDTLLQLLEKRETTQRLSPLMIIVGIGKSGSCWLAHAKDAVKLLLEYGARPDAKDVCGKTVCHYGMGCMATEMTLTTARYCMEAHQSSHLFNKEVELHSLKKETMNGLRGICRGYSVATGRRSVYVFDQQKVVAIKPENLRLVGADDADVEIMRPKLCDVPDRLGGVALLEVYMQGRVDVAKILLDEHHASIDVADVDNCSPRSMALHPGAGLMTPVAAMINQHALRLSRAEKRLHQNSCTKCGITDVRLFACSKCHVVQYCTKECQVSDWSEGGHKEECKQIRAEKNEVVVLEKPAPSDYFRSTFSLTTSALQPIPMTTDTFRKPSSVAHNEQFYIKIQGEGPTMPLYIYDKTQDFKTFVDPGTPGFDVLRAKVKADPATGGRKTYLKCSFDESNKCTIFLATRSIKTW